MAKGNLCKECGKREARAKSALCSTCENSKYRQPAKDRKLCPVCQQRYCRPKHPTCWKCEQEIYGTKADKAAPVFKRPKVVDDEYAVYQPWTPRPKPKPLMTDAQQQRIDADCLRRERELYQKELTGIEAKLRFRGADWLLTSPLVSAPSEPRILTAAERAEVAATITPLHLIRNAAGPCYVIREG